MMLLNLTASKRKTDNMSAFSKRFFPVITPVIEVHLNALTKLYKLTEGLKATVEHVNLLC